MKKTKKVNSVLIPSVQELFNAFVDVIIKKKGYKANVVSNTVQALNLVLFDVLYQEYEQIQKERKT